MTFIEDVQELTKGLILFRRADVQHRNWYCRVRVPQSEQYKTIALKTPDINAARDLAFDHHADIRFRVRHAVPVFNRSFGEVADDFIAKNRALADAGEITQAWRKIVESHIRIHLNAFVGTTQIATINEDKFRSYPIWRRASKTGRHASGRPVRDATIRQEMKTFRAVMNFAAEKGHIRENQIPKGKLPKSKTRRDEFTPDEYRRLHRFARGWVRDSTNKMTRWTRTMVYNYILIMANTGMRTIEARNLRWRDLDERRDRAGRSFLRLVVRGKSKHRELIAPSSVAEYFERIRAITKSARPDDPVFTNYDGTLNTSSYKVPIAGLLEKANLLIGTAGTRRSAYSLRHTYATFRLMEGVDVYFLAKQMGTSVKMIEDHYGHITPSTSTDQILQGMPGWQPVSGDNEPTTESD